MTLRERIDEAVKQINPRLEELAEGEIEVVDLDETRGILTVKLLGGRLHWCGISALSLWADKLICEQIPEIKEVRPLNTCGPSYQ
jgi:Fe-S cluster biogenesis protein NfuA